MLDLLRSLKDQINSSIMFITHDLGVIAEMADYVVVMYAGRIVEKGTVQEIFAHPAHPYTIGLMASKPVVGKQVDKLVRHPRQGSKPHQYAGLLLLQGPLRDVRRGLLGRLPRRGQPQPHSQGKLLPLL